MQPFTQFARDDFGASHAKTPLLPETDCAGGYGSAGSSSPSSSDAEQISSSVDALLHLDHPAYDKLLPPQEPGVLGTLKRWRDLVGLPLMAVYFLLSFTQELPVTAIAQLLVNDLNISPAAMQLFYAYTYLPWSIKPAFALISDYIPLFGFRRRPYVVACCLCAAVAYAFVSWSAHSDSSMLGLCVLASMMMCFAEVVADSVAVEIGNRFSHAPLLREPAIREATSTVLTAGASSVSADVAQQDLVPESPDAQPIAPLRQTMSLVDVESQSALNSGDPSSVSQPENAIVVGLDESCDLPPSAPADLETETLKLLACVKRETRASITARPGCTLDITAPASVQSAAMSVRTLGSIFASGLATALATFASPRQIILGAACIPLVAAIPALFLPDKPVSPLYFRTAMGAVCSLRGLQARLLQLAELIRLLWLPVLFTFVFNVMPTADDVYYYKLQDSESNFPVWQLSLFNNVALMASLLGTLTYGLYLSRVGVRRVFVVTQVLAALATFSQILFASGWSSSKLLIPDVWFVPVDGALVSFFAAMAVMPQLVLAAQSCPKGLEGLVFSIFAAAGHAGTLLSAVISSHLTDAFGISYGHYRGLSWLIVLCCTASLLPLVLVPFLPTRPFHLRSTLRFDGALSGRT